MCYWFVVLLVAAVLGLSSGVVSWATGDEAREAVLLALEVGGGTIGAGVLIMIVAEGYKYYKKYYA